MRGCVASWACLDRILDARARQRHRDSEQRPARLALAFDRALVLRDEGLRERETQTRPALAPRYQGIEDAISDGLRDARTVVLDMQFQCQAIALLAQRDLPCDPRAQHDAGVADGTPLGECQRGVVGDVEHRLDQLLAVADEVGDRGVVVALDRQAPGELGQDQRPHPLAHLVDVHVGHHVGAAMRRQQAVDQGLQPVGLVDDDLGVLRQALGLDLHLQQLRRAADAAERVLDLVRQVADQLLVGLYLAERALLAVLARLLLDLDQLDQRGLGALQLVDDHMHRQRLGAGAERAAQLSLQAAGRKLVVRHGGDRLSQQVRLVEPAEPVALEHAAARQSQHVLECRVGKQAAAVGPHHRHHGGEQVEGLVALRRRGPGGRVHRRPSHCASRAARPPVS